MKVLALELSSARGSVAVVNGGAVEFEREFGNDRKHSGAFFRALVAAQTHGHDVEVVVVGLGPGSYAGVRIAISAAIGLNSAIGARLIGLPSICAMATDEREFLVVGDARRQSYFCARIVNGESIDGPQLFSEEQLLGRLRESPLRVYSTERLARVPQAQVAFPSATRLARLSLRNGTTAPLEPIYLREPHITQPKQTANVLGVI